MWVRLITCDGKELQYRPDLGGFEQWGEIACLRCGICCTRWQPEVAAEEVHRMARGLGVSPQEFRQNYIDEHPYKPGLFLLRRNASGCVFLRYDQGQASCVVHPFRPEACRQWTPSLFRPECREGLNRKAPPDHLLLPDQVCTSPEDLSALCHSLRTQATGRSS